MHAQYMQEGTRRTNIICRMHVFHTYILWFQLTHFHGRWKHLWNFYTNVRPFHDMIVQISEYYLMVNYSLMGCRTLILYDIIDERYLDTGNLSYLSLLLLLYIYNTNKKKVYKNLWSHKDRTNYGTKTKKTA